MLTRMSMSAFNDPSTGSVTPTELGSFFCGIEIAPFLTAILRSVFPAVADPTADASLNEAGSANAAAGASTALRTAAAARVAMKLLPS